MKRKRWQRVGWSVLAIIVVAALVVAGWSNSPQHRFQAALDDIGELPKGGSAVLSEFEVCLRIDRLEADGSWRPVAWSKDVDEGSWYDADPFAATAAIEGIGLVCVGTQRLAPVEFRLPILPAGEYQLCAGESTQGCVPVEITR